LIAWRQRYQQVSNDQHRLKEKIEKDRIEIEVIETAEGRENEEKEKEVEKKMMENLFVNIFSSTVCDVILQEQKDKQVNDPHQLTCLKRKVVHNAFVMHLVCWWEANLSNTTHGIIYYNKSRWGSVG